MIKTIIELSYRKILRFVSVSQINNYLPHYRYNLFASAFSNNEFNFKSSEI